MNTVNHTPEQNHQLAKSFGERLAKDNITAADIKKMEPDLLLHCAEATDEEQAQVRELPVIPKWLNGQAGEPQQHYALFLATVGFYAASCTAKTN